ncbi:MAG: Mut7-C RNAse domain-containing protein [Bdellovibrionota bacterium]
MTRTFVLDVHLGRLARHLRMLGFDALWSADYQDDELVEIASSTPRILLTRDRALSERLTSDRCLLVAATDPREQLAEVIRRLSLQSDVRARSGFLTRCLDCNTPLLPAKPHQVTERVPGHLLVEHDQFFLCPRCERVYWKGSHWTKMSEWADRLISELSTD